MLILRETNSTYNLDHVPEETSEDIRYCVWDVTDITHTDFYWLPLIFLESFNAPAVVLEVGPYTIQMPLDWSVMVCDEEFTAFEVMPLTSLNDRGFRTVVFNPLTGMVPSTEEIVITDVYADVKWYFPKLKNGNVLVMPFHEGAQPGCGLFVKEATRVPDPMDPALLFE